SAKSIQLNSGCSKVNRHIGRIENCSTVLSRHVNGRGMHVEMILLCDFLWLKRRGCVLSLPCYSSSKYIAYINIMLVVYKHQLEYFLLHKDKYILQNAIN